VGSLLFWPLDRSPEQRATHDRLQLVETALPWAPVLLATATANEVVLLAG
jgi:hypothetical protein